MKLESQVCDLELSKKLKEHGVKQESLVYWLNIPDIVHMKLNEDGTIFEDENGSTVVDKIDYRQELGNPYTYNIDKDNRWSAFTVAELGDLLPDNLCINETHPNLFMAKGSIELNKWTVGYSTMESAVTPFYTEISEADARAKMLIYLIENKLITL